MTEWMFSAFQLIKFHFLSLQLNFHLTPNKQGPALKLHILGNPAEKVMCGIRILGKLRYIRHCLSCWAQPPGPTYVLDAGL